MSIQHEAVGALVNGVPMDKELLRNLLVGRYAYALRVDEVDPAQHLDLVAIDPDLGAVIPALIFQGKIYSLDQDDTTSEHDGVSCLVSSDGVRYKLEDLKVPTSVLDKDLVAPPVSPSIGNAYLIAGTPSGAWADFVSGDVAIFTSRGWKAISLPIGKLLYVVDEEGIYHRKADGTWAGGFGINALPDASIKVSQFIGGGDILHLIVENQSTNAPPVSPAKGDTYIIGNSPTGAWAGHAGKIARCENLSGTFTIYTPKVGWRVFDKALNADYRFGGTGWVSQSGAILAYSDVYTAGDGSWSTPGSGGYTYSSGTAPTTAFLASADGVTITHTARRAGAVLEFDYQVGGRTSADSIVVAIFRDTETNALDWGLISGISFQRRFRVLANDAASHIYAVRMIWRGSGIVGIADRRLFSLKEYA